MTSYAFATRGGSIVKKSKNSFFIIVGLNKIFFNGAKVQIIGQRTSSLIVNIVKNLQNLHLFFKEL